MFVPEKLLPTHHVNSLINQIKPWEKDIIPPYTHIDTKCNEKGSFFIFSEVLVYDVNHDCAQVQHCIKLTSKLQFLHDNFKLSFQ